MAYLTDTKIFGDLVLTDNLKLSGDIKSLQPELTIEGSNTTINLGSAGDTVKLNISGVTYQLGSINNLDDVSISSASTGNILRYNGTNWVNLEPSFTHITAGTLSDNQHGNRSGGSLHSAVTTSTNGFMTSGDKSKLDGVATSANNYTHPSDGGGSISTDLTNAAVISKIVVNSAGHVTSTETRNLTLANLGYTGDTNAQANQTISSGNGMNFTGGSGNVTITLGAPSTLNSSSINNVTSTSHTHAITNYSLSGTTNQISVSGSPKVLGEATILSLPQNIDTGATTRFSNLILGIDSNQGDLTINTSGAKTSPETAHISSYQLSIRNHTSLSGDYMGGIAFLASGDTSSSATPTAVISSKRNDSWGKGSLHFWVKTGTSQDSNLEQAIEIKDNADVEIIKNLVVDGNLTIQGNTTTLNTTTLQVEDKNIEIGKVSSPTDNTANGGGITLLGTTNKTIVWDSVNSNWTSSEHWNIASGKTYKINGTTVLSHNTLGSNVTTSSLTTVGTITTGTWQGTPIAVNQGGTGQTSYINGQLLIGNTTGNTLTKTTLTEGADISITNGAGSITINHANTSSQASSTNSGRTYIQSIELNDNGHVTSISTATETVTDTTYSVGGGISLSEGEFSVAAGDGLTQETSGLKVNSTSKTNWDSAHTHISNNGSDHSFINQNVTTTGTPTFVKISASQGDGSATITGTNTYQNTANLAGVRGVGGGAIGQGYLAGYINGKRAAVIGIEGDDNYGDSLAAYFEGEVEVTKTVNNLTLTASTSSFTIAGGTTTSRTLTVTANATIAHSTHASASDNQTITSGNGMNFTTGSGNVTITLGTPGALTASTTDNASENSHTHSISGFALSNHTHGSITNTGTITSDTAHASGFKFVMADASNNIVKSTISRGTATTTYLRNDGTWVTPPNDNTVTSIRRDNTGTYRTGNINLVGGTNVTITEPSTGVFNFASTNTTYSIFTNTVSGLVPTPNEAGTTKFLRQDQTWVVPTNTIYTDGGGISLSGTQFSVAAGDGLTQETSGLKVDNTVIRSATSSMSIGTATSITDSDQVLIYDSGVAKLITKSNLFSSFQDEKYVFTVHKEEFTATSNQTVFNLIDGQYLVGANRVNVYIWGIKQPNSSFTETNNTTITLSEGVSAGTKVLIEYFQTVNIQDHIHASTHFTGGVDEITPSDIGASADDHTHSEIVDIASSRILGRVTAGEGTVEQLTAIQVRGLINVADGANNYSLPTASSSVLGGVKIGSGVSISSGTISVSTAYLAETHDASGVTSAKITNWDNAHSHVSSDGSNHSFINQSVTTAASPTFTGLNLTNGSPYLNFDLGGTGTEGVYRVYSWGSSRTLSLESMGDVNVVLDYNNNMTDKKFTIRHDGEGILGTELFRVQDNGTVGINTTSPSATYKLDVNGYINGTKLYVSGTRKDSVWDEKWDYDENTIKAVKVNNAGNADTATALQTAINIGGVSFNGTASIDLPGVNITGNQNTTGSAATLTNTRSLWGQNFNGSVNVTGNISSTGNLTPATNNASDLGSNALRYRTGYFGTNVIAHGAIGAGGVTTPDEAVDVNGVVKSSEGFKTGEAYIVYDTSSNCLNFNFS